MVQQTSIILPCLNEEKSIGKFIDSIRETIPAEIIVVNNGSTDKSREIALGKGVKVIDENKRGYGNACRAGLENATGEKIIMLDCDQSYDSSDIQNFVKHLDEYDFVLGNRFAQMDTGAMHPLNKIGNFILRLVLRIRGLNNKEVCTGFIGIRKEKIPQDLKSPGMEFSSEMLLKTKKLNRKEIPIKFHKRIGSPKLRRFRDGLRHARYILLN